MFPRHWLRSSHVLTMWESSWIIHVASNFPPVSGLHLQAERGLHCGPTFMVGSNMDNSQWRTSASVGIKVKMIFSAMSSLRRPPARTISTSSYDATGTASNRPAHPLYRWGMLPVMPFLFGSWDPQDHAVLQICCCHSSWNWRGGDNCRHLKRPPQVKEMVEDFEDVVIDEQPEGLWLDSRIFWNSDICNLFDLFCTCYCTFLFFLPVFPGGMSISRRGGSWSLSTVSRTVLPPHACLITCDVYASCLLTWVITRWLLLCLELRV